jgi:hypothetical protein
MEGKNRYVKQSVLALKLQCKFLLNRTLLTPGRSLKNQNCSSENSIALSPPRTTV